MVSFNPSGLGHCPSDQETSSTPTNLSLKIQLVCLHYFSSSAITLNLFPFQPKMQSQDQETSPSVRGYRRNLWNCYCTFSFIWLPQQMERSLWPEDRRPVFWVQLLFRTLNKPTILSDFVSCLVLLNFQMGTLAR